MNAARALTEYRRVVGEMAALRHRMADAEIQLLRIKRHTEIKIRRRQMLALGEQAIRPAGGVVVPIRPK